MNDGASRKTETEGDRGVKKATARSLRGPLMSTSVATAEFAGSVAEALAEGWKSFRDHLDEDAILRPGIDNSLVGASVAASSRFMEAVAQAWRKSYENLKATAATVPPADIDYERLAKLVAEEMQKSGKKPI